MTIVHCREGGRQLADSRHLLLCPIALIRKYDSILVVDPLIVRSNMGHDNIGLLFIISLPKIAQDP